MVDHATTQIHGLYRLLALRHTKWDAHAMGFIVNEVITELRYDGGAKYLDLAGSLLASVSGALGQHFEHRFPTVERTEFHLRRENLYVYYGMESFVVGQNSPPEMANLELAAKGAWAEVSKALDIRKRVKRCGTRVKLLWERDNAAAAQRAVGGLCAPSAAWKELFGEPKYAATTAFHRDQRANLVRIGLMPAETPELARLRLPEEMKAKAPAHAVMLDVDVSKDDLSDLSGDALRAFIRQSWDHAMDLGQQLDDALE